MADAVVGLRWTGEALRFDGGAASGPEIRVDGEGATGPSPMRLLLLSLAGCTAADMVEILRKMRVSFEGLAIRQVASDFGGVFGVFGGVSAHLPKSVRRRNRRRMRERE